MFKVKIQGFTQQAQTFKNICTLTHVPHPSFLIKVIITDNLCRLVHSLTACHPPEQALTGEGRPRESISS